MNYRIGVFGAVSFDAMLCPDSAEYENSTALSLLDQIEALKWIKANISAFGGDPENITVAGNDAGGSCICLLSAVKEAKGLFKRALVLCASTTDVPAVQRNLYRRFLNCRKKVCNFCRSRIDKPLVSSYSEDKVRRWTIYREANEKHIASRGGPPENIGAVGWILEPADFAFIDGLSRKFWSETPNYKTFFSTKIE